MNTTFTLKIKPSTLMDELEKYHMSDEYLENSKKSKIRVLNKRIQYTLDELNSFKKSNWKNYITYCQLELDIYRFFKNCYNSDTFFKGLGRNVDILCQREFFYKNISNYKTNIYDLNFKNKYLCYQMRTILSAFKDVMVQYLGYHSIERLPKTITTSEFNIYETFYNYLLNDYNIVQIPRMIYDNNQKMYIPFFQNEFLVSDKELRLKNEIQSIKKLVPSKKRFLYYR